MKENKSKLLSAFVGLGFTLGASIPVAAQVGDGPEVEEIVVSGIRGGVERSVESKKQSGDIVDTISAEDVGKFPDANVAESLQRITGVSIDRSGGEGHSITVRGLGPSFNTVLFNGRMLATDATDRSFNLDTLASEVIKSVSVYKSGNSKITEGGIGGTVNIEMAKPLDNIGFHASGAVKGIYTESSGSTDPAFSAVISNTFLDDTLGVLGSINYSDRSQVNKAVINYQNVPGDMRLDKGPLWTATADADAKVIKDVVRPQSLDRQVMTEDRERVGGNIVIQYAPTAETKYTFDGLYSKFDTKSNGYTANTWFWYPTGNYPDAPGGKDPILDSEASRDVLFMQHGATGIASAYKDTQNPTDLFSLGLNVEQEITSNLKLNGDIFWSQAKNKNKGYNRQILIETDGLGYVEYDNTAKGDTPKLNQTAATIPSADNINKVFPAHYEARGNYIDAENIGGRLDFSYAIDSGIFSTFDFGLSKARNEKSNIEYSENFLGARLYKYYAKDPAVMLFLPSDLLTISKIGGNWDGIDDTIFKFKSLDSYLKWFSDPANLAKLDAAPGAGDSVASFNNAGGIKAQATPNAYTITEDVDAMYASANLKFDLGDIPTDLAAGARIVRTDLASRGTIRKLTDLKLDASTPTNPNPVTLQPVYASNGSYTAVSESNKYTNVLPNITWNVHVTDDVILRSSYSKTLTRPSLDNVAPWQQLNGGSLDCDGNGVANDICGAGSASNPNLKPYLSTNVDFSAEWYYSSGSLVSFAVFKKDVKDWVVNQISVEKVALASYQGGVDYKIDRPRNINSASIDGFEANWIHIYESGFGTQLNYTGINSNANLSKESNFALEGLSDSANAIAFYEKNGFQVRVAYNWRGSFLQKTSIGWLGEPMYVGEYSQIDMSASYDFTDDITVFVEGVNITDQNTRKFGRTENQFLQYLEFGPRYTLGVRARF